MARVETCPNTPRRNFTSSPPPFVTHDEEPIHDDLQRSGIDTSIQVKQMRARENVAILREGVLRTRRTVKDQRVELRQREEDVMKAINTLTRKLAEIVTSVKLEDVSVLHDSLKIAHDRLGPVEFEYEKLELRLEDEEWNLEEEEAYFYRYHHASTNVSEARVDALPSPRTRKYQASEVDSSASTLDNELLRNYLDKVADVECLKEELDGLESDFVRFSEEADFRRKHSIDLSKELSIFFEEYLKVHADLIRDVYDTEDEIFDLRDKCIDEGVFGDDEHKYEPYSALSEEWMEPVYYTEDRSPFKVAARRNMSRSFNLDYGDKQDSVNCWILGGVQESAIHILMLKVEIFSRISALPDLKDNAFNDDKWADMAIEHWYQDGMGNLASENFNASRLDQIFGSSCISQNASTGFSGVPGIIDSLRSFKVNPEFAAELLGSGSYSAESVNLETEPSQQTDRRMSSPVGFVSVDCVNLEAESSQQTDRRMSSPIGFIDTTISQKPQRACHSLPSSPNFLASQSMHKPSWTSI